MMIDCGFPTMFSVEPFSVMGAVDVLRVLPLADKRSTEISIYAAENAVDVVVFIDGWAFSRLAAKKFRQTSPATTVLKYVAPQVWASRPERINFVKDYFDGVLAVLPFETDIFCKAGIRAEFIGNPIFQTAFRDRGNGEGFRARHGIADDTPIMAVLLGSRRSELQHLATPFRRTVELLCDEICNLRVLSVPATGFSDGVRDEISKWPGNPIIVSGGEKYDAFSASNVALAASGTVTTELAINSTPIVIGYKVDPFTALWAKQVKKTPYASIINIVANNFVIPEFIQERCTPELLSTSVRELLENPNSRNRQLREVDSALGKLEINGPPASERAATRVLEWADLARHRYSI
jgi:lipid-A-disaccharide synthase